jgi:hypothetical protein
MKHFAMIALAAFGALLATAPGAPAQSPPDVNCPPYAGVPSTVHNVTVPDNKACQLVGVTVTGNVTVGRGATLEVIGGGGTISGNVQGNNCTFVLLDQSVVGGNVQIGNCAQGGEVNNSVVGGDLQCYNNTGRCAVEVSTILGNV